MNRFGAIVGTLLLLVLAGMAGALESQVFTVEESNLYVELGPDFQVYESKVDANNSGMFSYNMGIKSTDPAAEEGVFISVFSVYDDVMRRMKPTSLIDLFLTGGVIAVEEGGDEITDSWDALSSTGENVTVYTINTETSLAQVEVCYMSCWNPSENDYVLMISSMDQNATERLIETLTIN